ncbi:MAG: Na+/H+ antiporter NhaC family protein, partial [Acidobacteriota bacterium]
LVRGNLMRPITDRLRISREKLAFFVDVGAATVASTFFISTWIGYEVGLIDQGLKIIGSELNAYTVFLQTIPYLFYPITALILAFLIAVTGRDFGPMWEAERRCRVEGKPLRDGAEPATDLAESGEFDEDVPARWINGALPVISILVVGILGLYMTGIRALDAEGATGYGIGDIVGAADSYKALLWASLTGCIVAIMLSVVQGILTVHKAIEAWIKGLKSMLLAMIILILAWSIGSVTEELHTADYLVQMLRDVLSPYWLPSLTFIIAALVAFSTGTSWATMAILMPLVIPLSHTLGVDLQLPAAENHHLMLGVISSVLSGAVFGDHCSPISDTTILSSMASACDHIDHVRTQLPYALLAAVGGVLIGDIPTAYGFSPWVSLSLSTVVMFLVLMLFGRKVPDYIPETETEPGSEEQS